MLKQNTNNVNGTPMSQKLEKGSKTKKLKKQSIQTEKRCNQK